MGLLALNQNLLCGNAGATCKREALTLVGEEVHLKEIWLKLRGMCDDKFARLSLNDEAKPNGAVASSASGQGVHSVDVTEKQQANTTCACSPPNTSSASTRKVRERIARGHRIFKNMQLALSECAQVERNSVSERRVRTPRVAPADRLRSDSVPKPASYVVTSVDELVELLFMKGIDQKHILSSDNVTLSDEDWSQFACHVVDAAMKGNRELAVDIAVIAVGHESFQSTFAERIKEMMSNYVLSERKAEEGIVELIALLLITKWPREHARCGLESNAILFSIISSIKGWLMAVIGEVDQLTLCYFQDFFFALIFCLRLSFFSFPLSRAITVMYGYEASSLRKAVLVACIWDYLSLIVWFFTYAVETFSFA
ncbi:unnamed protein product [Gongylonema pulchrum]|uniref:LisH domain-containing protein n=1 Tax=Gongylonema pulchrum TaxID=637853 RepID=A0A183DYZ6_9BILA|nr:unnamed protein product [Gongylonema pulchrum]